MAIELTSASKSTRLGVLSALDAGITGLPLLDGISYAGKAEVVWSNEAVEGISIPNGASDSFVKTYTLSRSYPNGAFVVAAPTLDDCLGLYPFFKLAQVASTFPTLSSQQDINYSHYLVSLFGNTTPGQNFRSKLIYVTNNYTNAVKLNFTVNSTGGIFPSPLDANGTLITELGFGKTYSQLVNNCLIGTYGGPFGGGPDDSYLRCTSSANRFVLQSAYMDGNSIKFLFKKQASSSSAELAREGILIVDGSL